MGCVGKSDFYMCSLFFFMIIEEVVELYSDCGKDVNIDEIIFDDILGEEFFV